MALSEAEGRIAVSEAGLSLMRSGLVARTWGNISVRLDQDRMAISPSGVPYEEIGVHQVAIVNIATGEWSGPLKPSGERGLHGAIYRTRPDVGAVIHTHQSAASVFATARNSLAAAGAIPVPCAIYGLPGTKSLAKGTVSALGSGKAAFMANHGAVCVGEDLKAAFRAAVDLEATCADHLSTLAGAGSLPCRADTPWTESWIQELPQEDALRDATGIGCQLRSRAPYTVAFSRQKKALPAVLDDMAQLIGSSVPVMERAPRPLKKNCVFVRGEGALLAFSDRYEAEAAAMVLEKSCRAAMAGALLGSVSTIPLMEALLMRAVYLKKYSKLRGTSPLRSR